MASASPSWWCRAAGVTAVRKQQEEVCTTSFLLLPPSSHPGHQTVGESCPHSGAFSPLISVLQKHLTDRHLGFLHQPLGLSQSNRTDNQKPTITSIHRFWEAFGWIQVTPASLVREASCCVGGRELGALIRISGCLRHDCSAVLRDPNVACSTDSWHQCRSARVTSNTH